MDDMDRLYHIGGCVYLKRDSNGTYDAEGNLTGCFTVGIPENYEPPTHAEMTALAADMERRWQERQRHVEAVGAEISARAADNRDRFFHD